MDGKRRCDWVGQDERMCAYHDAEWGVPLHDGRALWEALVIDGFQAGLSWQVILRKRETFRAAFRGFDPAVVAAFDEQDIERLMADPGIVRSRAKIAAAIGNAKAYLAMEAAGEAFAPFCWAAVGGKPIQAGRHGQLAKTPESERLSAALKKRGFKFVGPVIVYAWMQAVGLVNDHQPHCFRRDPVRALAGSI